MDIEDIEHTLVLQISRIIVILENMNVRIGFGISLSKEGFFRGVRNGEYSRMF